MRAVKRAEERAGKRARKRGERRSARYTTLALAGLLAVTSPALAETQDCSGETCRTIPSLAAERGGFVFSDWQGPDLPIWTYVPEEIDRTSAPIVFVMHGARRDPQSYREQWIEEAEEGGFIVIAPEFSREDFPRAWGYNLGAMLEPETGEWREEGLWSFSAIEPIFDEAVARLNGSQTHYSIYGHSAGSQFVHRFLFMKPSTRANRFLAANAGWYTFADPAIAFPFGLGGIPLSEGDLRAALAKDVVILLGDEDNDRNHSSLNRSDGAMQQGPHRLARGRAFFAAARDYAAARGWEFGWSLRVIEGVAHSNAGMAAGAFDLIE